MSFHSSDVYIISFRSGSIRGDKNFELSGALFLSGQIHPRTLRYNSKRLSELRRLRTRQLFSCYCSRRLRSLAKSCVDLSQIRTSAVSRYRAVIIERLSRLSRAVPKCEPTPAAPWPLVEPERVFLI